MTEASPLLLVVDLAGVFAFSLNGALTAIRLARVDLVGVITLGVFTALGGGIIRDVLLDALPPTTFSDWRYLAVASLGGLVAFAFGLSLDRLAGPIHLLDAAGLSLFAVSGALKALDLGAGVLQAVVLGVITAVGGGTLRDVLIREVPSVLTSGLYAIPAAVAASMVAVAAQFDAPALPVAVVAAVSCFLIRVLGVRYGVEAPKPWGAGQTPSV